MCIRDRNVGALERALVVGDHKVVLAHSPSDHRAQFRMAQNPEALKQALQRNGTLVGIENGLRDDKIFAAILADVQVTDSTAEREPETETSET